MAASRTKEVTLGLERALTRFRRRLLRYGFLTIALSGLVIHMAVTRAPAWYFAHILLWGVGLIPLGLLSSNRWIYVYSAPCLAALVLGVLLLSPHDTGLFVIVAILGVPTVAIAAIHSIVLFRRYEENGRIHAIVLAFMEAQLKGARAQLESLPAAGENRKRNRLEACVRELGADAEDLRRERDRLGVSPFEYRTVSPPRIHNPLRALASLESAIDSAKDRLRRALSMRELK